MKNRWRLVDNHHVGQFLLTTKESMEDGERSFILSVQWESIEIKLSWGDEVTQLEAFNDPKVEGAFIQLILGLAEDAKEEEETE